MTISIQLPILFRRTTDEQSIKFATKFEEKRARIGNGGGLGRWRRLLVYDTFEAHVTENEKAVFAKENSNLALIPHRLTSVL